MNNTEEIFVVSKAFCDCFNVVTADKVEETIKRATEFYTKEAETYRKYLVDYPHNAEHWKTQLEKCERTLAEGFEGVKWDEYCKRQKERWVSKSAKEVTAEEYEDMLNVLPPYDWHQGENESWFFMSERLTMTFTSQYYHDKRTGKYYTAVVDLCDKNTWIDKLLKEQSYGTKNQKD